MSLNNNNSKVLFLGEDYMVARKEDNQWLLLNGNNAWTDIGIVFRTIEQPKAIRNIRV